MMYKLITTYCRSGWLLILGIVLSLPSAVWAKGQPMMITVTKGFGLTLYASEVGDAKQLAIGDKGTLFVGSYKKALSLH